MITFPRWRKSIARASRPVVRMFRPRLEGLEERSLLSGVSLDPSFGHGGIVKTYFSILLHEKGTKPVAFEVGRPGYALALLPSGKFLVAGASETPKPTLLLSSTSWIVSLVSTRSLRWKSPFSRAAWKSRASICPPAGFRFFV